MGIDLFSASDENFRVVRPWPARVMSSRFSVLSHFFDGGGRASSPVDRVGDPAPQSRAGIQAFRPRSRESGLRGLVRGAHPSKTREGCGSRS
jgi:hypothetical protein